MEPLEKHRWGPRRNVCLDSEERTCSSCLLSFSWHNWDIFLMLQIGVLCLLAHMAENILGECGNSSSATQSVAGPVDCGFLIQNDQRK